MICVATVQNRGEDTHLDCYVVDVSRSAKEGFFCFLVRDWKGVCRKLLSLVFLNFHLLAKRLNFIFIKVTWKLGYLRRLNFVQGNWLRGNTSCLHWRWLIYFRLWCQTFPPKISRLEVSRREIFMINRIQLKTKNKVLYVRKT